MSLTGEMMHGAARCVALEPMRGARTLVRASIKLLATGFALSVALLWLSPGAAWDGDVLLLKAILTVTLSVIAWSLFKACRPDRSLRHVQVDLVRREVRVLRFQGGKAVPDRVCAFDKLSAADCSHGVIGLWDENGNHLADVGLRDRDAARLLTSALRDAGKL